MTHHQIDDAILSLTRGRGPMKTVCPSEVARHLTSDDWRALMQPIRDRARVLAVAGRIEITQSGKAIDPTEDWRGPIRLRSREQ